ATVGSVTTSLSLTNNPGSASAINKTAGDSQATSTNSPFATQLQATVTDANGNTLSNQSVTFTITAGQNGSSGTFSTGGTTAMATTNSSGVATAPVITANATAGTFTVTAALTSSPSINATYTLTIRVGQASQVLVVSGSGQSAGTTTAFASPLVAKAVDAGGNGVANVQVTFTAPSAGASGTFAGATNTVTVITNSSGLATSPTFTANGTQGSYTVVASVSGVSSTASFSLTNTQGPCNGCGTITVSNVTVGQNLETPITITFNPAPTTAIILNLASSDPTKALLGSGGAQGTGSISPKSPNIPAGTTSTTIFVQALVGTGTATITASAQGYNSGTGTVTFVPSGFILSGPNGVGAPFNIFQSASDTLTVTPVILDSSGAPGANQPVRGGLSVSVPISNSNSSVGTVSPTSAALNGGDNSSIVTFTASSTQTGSTTLTAGTPSGFTPPSSGNSVTATVQQASIVPFTTTVGQNLETTQTISLSGPAPGPVSLTLTSSNGSVEFSCGSTPVTLCTCGGSACSAPAQSITLVFQTGHAISPQFLVEGFGSNGSVSYTASAPSYGSVNGSVNLARSTLEIQGPSGLGAPSFTGQTTGPAASLTIFTGYLDNNGNFAGSQNVADGVTAAVTISSSDTTVGTVSPTSFNITSGNDSGTTTVSPTGKQGSTVITASASGFISAQVTANFVPPSSKLLLTPNDTTIGNHLESLWTLDLPQNAGSGGQAVTITSTSGSVLLSATDAATGSTSLNLTVPAGQSSITFWVQGGANSGTATVTASASGFTSATQTVTLAPSGFGIVPQVFGSPNSSGSAQIFVGWLDSGGTPHFGDEEVVAAATLGVSSSNSSVAAVSSTFTFPALATSGNLPVTFGSAGSATITITQPSGFTTPSADQSSAVTVQ
ncbi:MAG: hypothetical protein JO061_05670, partial [Acidobacteriaceae bacterium]|nr:hypothetical protein [Acidobacteriaceae bacterium]